MANIGYSKNCYQTVVNCTSELLNQALDSAEVKQICEQIAQKLEQVKQGTVSRAEFDKFKTEMKQKLPVLTPHAIFKNGRHRNSEAIPSGLSMYDIDHIENPRGYYQAMVADRLSELGIVMAYVTPSCEGLRLIFEMPEGMTLAEAQQWMSQQLGDSNYDGVVKDYARLSYLVPRAYLLYLDEEELLKDRRVDMKVGTSAVKAPSSSTAVQPLSLPALGAPKEQHLRIFDLSLEKVGLKPCDIDIVGVHNWHQTLLAVLSLGISRLMTKEELLAVLSIRMPNYLKEKDCLTLVSDFYGQYDKGNAPMTQMQLGLMRDSMKTVKPAKVTVRELQGPEPPKMPEKLPRLIKLLVAQEPAYVALSIAMGCFPALGAHLYDVHFLYNDNTYREATFMHHTMAKTSSGKAGVGRICEAVMHDIAERDLVNRAREQEYKDECSRQSANKQRPERPDDLVVQMLMTDITNAALVQKGADAHGHFIYSLLNEVEFFNKFDASRDKISLRNAIQTAFDTDWYGQERVGEKSVTARFPLHWNWNASSTIQRAQKFYDPMLADGSFNRLSFSTIIPSDEEGIPKHRLYDAKFMAKLKPFIDKLNAAHGNYNLKKATDLARRINEEAIDTYRLSDDEDYYDTSHRAVILAWLRAMVLYIAEGKWTKEIEDFAVWSYRYDMWCKMTYFGDALHEQMKGESTPSLRGPKNMLELLPDEFTDVDAKAVRVKVGKDDHDPYKMLWTWQNRGFITQDPLTGVYRKTDKYLAKHPKVA